MSTLSAELDDLGGTDIAHVLASLGVHTRVQAVIAASRAGLIQLRPPDGP